MLLDLGIRAHLTMLYSEPQRHYHNLEHVFHLIREYRALEEHDSSPLGGLDPKNKMALEFAIWFHDCVYDPKAPRHQNESDSANLAFSTLWAQGDIYRQIATNVADIILATQEHFDAPMNNATINVFLDLDLCILGADKDTYKKYAENIRKEYSHVSRKDYIEGRTKLLKNWNSRPQLFRTVYFVNKYEKAARENIQWEINNLSSWV